MSLLDIGNQPPWLCTSSNQAVSYHNAPYSLRREDMIDAEEYCHLFETGSNTHVA
jgi:hypothetical protein